jgi:hypothetical protein
MYHIYLETNSTRNAESEWWDNVSKEKYIEALFALRRILGIPDDINGKRLK